jgi:multiple sugar transport system ATP-binding protein
MATVKLINITKRFGDVVAVNKVTLHINDGEFFCLLGPSGSGKTTILRLIAGLEVPDEGDIYIDDKRVNNVHPKDRDVAMVFQSYALYPHMSIYENIAFPLLMRRKKLGLTHDEIRKRVYEVAQLLRIKHLLDRKPSQLSGGEQQRVALARAIVRKPKVFLMDEPLSNLDAKLRLYMRGELRKLQKELGVTTIYVTHDQVEAMATADRLAVINKGSVMQAGTPEELYSKPANTFVAGFIGVPPMNLINATIISREGKYVLKTNDTIIPIDSGLLNKVIESGFGPDVTLGVRPEDIVISKEPEINSIKGTVVVTEVLGSETIINVKLGESLLRAKVLGRVRYDTGELIYIVFKQSKIHLFDGKTGKAII